MSQISDKIQAIRPHVYLLHVGCLGLAAFLLPLKIHYCNIATGVSFGLWLISSTKASFIQSRSTYVFYWVVLSLYIIQLIGLPYSDNLRHGFFMLETKLGLVLFPTMILLSPLSNKHIEQIFKAFIAGVLIACLWCHAHAISTAINSDISFRDFFLSERFHNDLFTAPIKMHPAYLSLCISIIFFYILDEKLRKPSSTPGWYIVFFYLSFCLFVLMSRAAVIAFGAGLFVYVAIKVFYFQKRYVTGLIVLGGFAFLIIVFLTIVPDFKLRMVELVSNLRTDVKSMKDNSTTLHVRQWYCAWNSVSGPQIIWGHGTGDEIDVLMNCYIENLFDHLVQKKLDAHNEYLSSFVRHGLIGLLLFVAVLCYCFIQAFREKNIQYLVFIVMIAVHAMAVSILYGQASLVIYALFNALFIKKLLNKKELKQISA